MPIKHHDTATISSAADALTIRPLAAGDLAAVVALDKAVSGRSRRGFYEKRMAHLVHEPTAFVALAAQRQENLVGFILARLYEGEFGAQEPQAALDSIGVAADARHHGVGRRLVDAMVAAMRIHGIKEIATEADWTDTRLTGFFARTGFALAPRLVLERAVRPGDPPMLERKTAASPARREGAEIDHSGPAGGDFEAMSHDRVPIRSMTAEDLAAILQIDRRLTGRNRSGYFKRKLAEAMNESGVRVSLVAEPDEQVAGFIMARVDFGEFGSLEPEAVIDTIGVAAASGHKGVGSALLSQLMTNLQGLRIERVRTEVDWNHFGLLNFLDRAGFRPRRRLVLHRVVE